jgi:hypothetical protein
VRFALVTASALNRPAPTCADTLGKAANSPATWAPSVSPRHVVPGHDPRVMQRYPAVSWELEGIAVRLDVMPSE